MAEWILPDRLATNKPECEAFVEQAADEFFAHMSEHVSFQLVTPTFTMRLNYKKLHQLAVRDATHHLDLPEHMTHPINLGLSGVILGKFLEGIQGETTAIQVNTNDVPIMTGITAIAGNKEDSKVGGMFVASFTQASQ